jgi:hypothetical protein
MVRSFAEAMEAHIESANAAAAKVALARACLAMALKKVKNL